MKHHSDVINIDDENFFIKESQFQNLNMASIIDLYRTCHRGRKME